MRCVCGPRTLLGFSGGFLLCVFIEEKMLASVLCLLPQFTAKSKVNCSLLEGKGLSL